MRPAPPKSGLSSWPKSPSHGSMSSLLSMVLNVGSGSHWEPLSISHLYISPVLKLSPLYVEFPPGAPTNRLRGKGGERERKRVRERERERERERRKYGNSFSLTMSIHSGIYSNGLSFYVVR